MAAKPHTTAEATTAATTDTRYLPRVETVDQTTVHRIWWTVPTAPAQHVPTKQALERVVVSALVGAYPARGPEVTTWLASRSSPPADDDALKAQAWSHLAGWYSASGFQRFYEAVWEDPAVAAELDRLLALPLAGEPAATVLAALRASL